MFLPQSIPGNQICKEIKALLDHVNLMLTVKSRYYSPAKMKTRPTEETIWLLHEGGFNNRIEKHLGLYTFGSGQRRRHRAQSIETNAHPEFQGGRDQNEAFLSDPPP